jgi:hypothetical protein
VPHARALAHSPRRAGPGRAVAVAEAVAVAVAVAVAEAEARRGEAWRDVT